MPPNSLLPFPIDFTFISHDVLWPSLKNASDLLNFNNAILYHITQGFILWSATAITRRNIKVYGVAEIVSRPQLRPHRLYLSEIFHNIKVFEIFGIETGLQFKTLTSLASIIRLSSLWIWTFLQIFTIRHELLLGNLDTWYATNSNYLIC